MSGRKERSGNILKDEVDRSCREGYGVANEKIRGECRSIGKVLGRKDSRVTMVLSRGRGKGEEGGKGERLGCGGHKVNDRGGGERNIHGVGIKMFRVDDSNCWQMGRIDN